MKTVTAGTLESSDIYITLEPLEQGLRIELQSVVTHQFGTRIQEVIREMLQVEGADCLCVRAVDRGALDCVIRARMETALRRRREAMGL